MAVFIALQEELGADHAGPIEHDGARIGDAFQVAFGLLIKESVGDIVLWSGSRR
jgi:hypothetical protein